MHYQRIDFGVLTPELGGTIGDRYRILGELGRGTMATVYRARDLRHGTDVAFKLLRREFAGSVAAKRFVREIEIASTLEHPNIIPVLDSGDLLELPFYVMPMVDGDTLDVHVGGERRMDVADAIRLTGEIAMALSYAHAHGVVHRDIKPSNVLVSQGHALLADFGIARIVDLVSDRLTDSDITMGTAPYMSPEQFRTASVDGRGDTYSLGCVLYEMLTGHPPFRGSSPEVLHLQHSTAPVPSLRAARREVPLALESAVLKALAKTPEERYADPIDFKLAIEEGIASQGQRTWLQALRAALRSPRA